MDITKALEHGWPGAQWKMLDEDIDKLEWIGPGAKPLLAEIEAAWADYTGKRQAKSARAEKIKALSAAIGDPGSDTFEAQALDYLAQLKTGMEALFVAAGVSVPKDLADKWDAIDAVTRTKQA